MATKITQFLVIILISLSISHAQYKIEKVSQNSNNIKLDISLYPVEHKIESNSNNLNIVLFENCFDESKPGELNLPYKTIFVALPFVSKVSINSSIISSEKIKGYPKINPEIILKNDSTISYKEVSQLNLQVFKTASDIAEITGYIWIRNYYCAVIKIKQYQYDNSDAIQQINSIHLELNVLNSGSSLKQTINQPDKFEEYIKNLIVNYDPSLALDKKKYSNNYASFNSWIDYSKTYLKMGVNHNGIYQIKPSDLTAYSIDVASIDPLTFRIFSKGKEIPIYVHNKNSNQPTSWDYLEFFGYRNMGGDYKKVNAFNTPYNEYLDRYSDTTVYWLTWGGTQGMRIDTLKKIIKTNIDTVSTYTEIAHYESDQWFDYSVSEYCAKTDPEWIENETWVWGQQGVGTSGRSFTVSNVVPNKKATAFYKVQDFATDVNQNAHRIGLSINSDPNVFGLSYVNRNEQKVISGTFSSNLLKSGSNNLNTISYATSASLNSIEYDWYEVDYPRYLRAISDSLEFQITDTLAVQPAAIKITNLVSKDFSIYKIAGGLKKITDFNLSNNTISFIDTVTPGSKYYLVTNSKLSKPIFYYKKKFTSLSADSIQADYILITNSLFQAEAKKYTDFIQKNYNVRTKTVNVNDIYDEFNYGFFAPEPIKYFLQSAFNQWRSPKPSYVFLVGDANYDYYGNKVKYFAAPASPNYVPSFGVPASDTWFVVWDSTQVSIPQMYIGRIPVKNVKDFDDYLVKHQSYLNSSFDDWNKHFLFISGGDLNSQSELSSLKGVNDSIINDVVKKPPISGLWNHLYKTLNPITSLGPYTTELISSIMDSGAVAISYIGHSGTQIWDNGITDPSQLTNKRGKYSFVTDFGCSTGKFAEPDIISFGELFVVGASANAIGFIGNSSLGFTSTTLTFPQLFYKQLLNDKNYSLGQAHIQAKINLLTTYGTGGTYRIFSLCNTLFADPIIKLKIPAKPNYSINSSGIHLANQSYDSSTDSVKVTAKYYNFGLVSDGTINIKVASSYNSKKEYETIIKKNKTQLQDSLSFYLKIKGKAGAHNISITLDPDNLIDEIYKNDNTAEFQVNVMSTDIRDLFTHSVENLSGSTFKFLNPTFFNGSDSLLIQYDLKNDFSTSINKAIKLGDFYSSIAIQNISADKRYWLRTKLKGSSGDYSRPLSFYYNSQPIREYYFNDSLNLSNGTTENIFFSKNGLVLSNTSKKLVVAAAGYYDGNYASVMIDGIEYLSNGLNDGPHVVAFDNSLNFLYAKTFNYWDNTVTFENNFFTFMDTVSNNKIIVFVNNGGGGAGFTAKIKTAIKNFGSALIDKINFRYSWAMIGRKGAAIGSVPEALSEPYKGAVRLDSIFIVKSKTGKYITPKLGPVNNWKNIKINSTYSDPTQLTIYPIGFKSGNVTDTLSAITLSNNSYDLSSLNLYHQLQFLIKYDLKNYSSSPSLNSINVGYSGLPELGTNYQVISIPKDTVEQGENVNLTFSVYNAGDSRADNFKITVEVIKKDNTREKIYEFVIDSLGVEKKKQFNISYATYNSPGSNNFYVMIDSDNKILELYKDNNYYTKSFYVKPNTKPAALKLLINGNDIVNGDYISSQPNIRIELTDQSLIPVRDTSVVQLYLNTKRIYFLNNSTISYSYSTSNPKFVLNYNPALANGDYELKVLGKNASGQLIDSTGVVRRFTVQKDLQLLEAYNYPNPFSKDTYFTFKLTQVPDELTLKIYTIAGRMIKEFKLTSSELRFDFNRIYWDGLDTDGDPVANGVYLYKIVSKKGTESTQTVQKLAIVR